MSTNTPRAVGRRPLLHLPEAEWPAEDRMLFATAFETPADIFADEGGGSRLKPSTRSAIGFAYRRWLGWVSMTHPGLMARPPETRVTPENVKDYVRSLGSTCAPRSVASQASKLLDALRFMCPRTDWNWLRILATRLERAVPKRGRKPISITSARAITICLGRLDVIDQDFARTHEHLSRKRLQAIALDYRDVLLVAVSTFLPLRRTNLAQLLIGSTMRRRSSAWEIAIPGDMVKNGEPISADLPEWIGDRVDRYLTTYRPLIFASRDHTGFWASAKGQPATGDALYAAFQKQALRLFQLNLTLHDTRRIGATTWAIYDPVNAAGAKDLLGDRSDSVFTQHYNLADGIEASRRMAEVLRTAAKTI